MKDTCGVERVVDGTIVLLPVRVGANATGIFDFKVKGRGVTDGKTVEHEAIVRYNHASAGYVYGPMQVGRAAFTVAEPPRVLITGPDSVSLGTPLKLAVRRFGEAKQTGLILRPKSSTGPLRIDPVPDSGERSGRNDLVCRGRARIGRFRDHRSGFRNGRQSNR